MSAELESDPEGVRCVLLCEGGGPAKVEIQYPESWAYSSHSGGL